MITKTTLKMNLKKMFVALGAGLMLVSCDPYKDLPEGMYASIQPEKGKEILVRLYYREVPMTVGNFVALAEGTMQGNINPAYKGKRFFDSLLFHRVEKDFVIQAGDPTGSGAGDPGYFFPVEPVDSIKHAPGVIAMANSNPRTNGSQFYITMSETPHLDGGRFTVFGRLVRPEEDMERVKAVRQGDRIRTVKIIRKGTDAENWDAYRAFEENLPKVEAAYQQRVQQALDEFFKDAQVTKSGLKIRMIEKGSGRPYRKGETASLHYVGKLEDGTMFDSSSFQGEPLRFEVGSGRVIKGFDEAVSQLPIGSRAVVWIPSELAYGDRDLGRIKPHTNLVFELEILAPEKK